MNVWDYLYRNGQRETVINALNSLRITQDERDGAIAALKQYQFVINHRAKSRFGVVKTKQTRNRLTGEVTIIEQVMELTSEYFTRGYELHPERSADHMNTLLHESAHIITDVIRPKASAHGSEWKAVMRALGANPSRTGNASFLAEAREIKRQGVSHKHLYTCDKCGYEHGTNRQLKNMDRRKHKNCGGHFTHKQLR